MKSYVKPITMTLAIITLLGVNFVYELPKALFTILAIFLIALIWLWKD